MSFGDLRPTSAPAQPSAAPSSPYAPAATAISAASSPTPPHSSPAPFAQLSSSPPQSDLVRLLKPLALNNASLQQAIDQVAHAPTHTALRRLRALRDQNRGIASAAAARVAAAADAPPQDARALNDMLADYSRMLAQSVDVERGAVAQLAAADAAAAGDDDGGSAAASATATMAAAQPPTQGEVAGAPYGTFAAAQLQKQPVHVDATTDALAHERTTLLADIQSSVEDVNAVFNELAVLVGEQRSHVEYIDVSTGDAAFRVEQARRQLEKTKRRREARKGLFFCSLFSIAAIIAIVICVLVR